MTESIIEKQIGILRSILSHLAENDNNGTNDFIKYTNKYFGFDTEFDWNILMNSFYVFEDTELAKKDFDEFGLQGPSRHINIGEKYLRLYGVLNTFYQQFLATKNLIELFKLDNKSKHVHQLKNTKCIILRNKIAAHSTNYSENPKNGTFDVYEISRSDLERDRIELLKNQDSFETYELNTAISDFNQLVQAKLSLIIEKFIYKKFKNKGRYYEEYRKTEKLRNGAVEFGGQIIEFKK